ncbi:unnamed protein product [Leuciscus chuanchicus]
MDSVLKPDPLSAAELDHSIIICGERSSVTSKLVQILHDSRENTHTHRHTD